MAEGLIAAAANTLLTTLVTTYPYVKLHVGAPGAAATANAAVNTTRQQASWGTATGGAVETNTATSWTSVSGTEDYTHLSGWTASTGGTVGWTGTVTANAVTTGDTFTIPSGGIDIAFTVAS